MSAEWPALAELVQRGVAARIGVAVTYRAGGAPPGVSIKAPFGNPHQLLAIGEGVEVQDSRPVLFVRLSELAALGVTPARGDEFDVASVTYTVAEVRTDGEGGADLFAEIVEAP